MSWNLRPIATAGALLTALAVAAPAASAAPLNGTLRILPGTCTDAGVIGGSTFRLVEPTGSTTTGPFFENPDSPCVKQTFTLLRAGTDGGIATGRFQGSTTKAFDRTGNSRLGRIIEPVQFSGIRFGLGSFAKDPVSGSTQTFTAPRVDRTGSKLTAKVGALTAGWNSQYFNQGSATATGTYNAKTKRYTLKWTSKVVGGPFNGFTGIWSLKGQFVPRR